MYVAIVSLMKSLWSQFGGLRWTNSHLSLVSLFGKNWVLGPKLKDHSSFKGQMGVHIGSNELNFLHYFFNFLWKIEKQISFKEIIIFISIGAW